LKKIYQPQPPTAEDGDVMVMETDTATNCSPTFSSTTSMQQDAFGTTSRKLGESVPPWNMQRCYEKQVSECTLECNCASLHFAVVAQANGDPDLAAELLLRVINRPGNESVKSALLAKLWDHEEQGTDIRNLNTAATSKGNIVPTSLWLG
jgi:hypothetical protein